MPFLFRLLLWCSFSAHLNSTVPVNTALLKLKKFLIDFVVSRWRLLAYKKSLSWMLSVGHLKSMYRSAEVKQRPASRPFFFCIGEFWLSFVCCIQEPTVNIFLINLVLTDTLAAFWISNYIFVFRICLFYNGRVS